MLSQTTSKTKYELKHQHREMFQKDEPWIQWQC